MLHPIIYLHPPSPGTEFCILFICLWHPQKMKSMLQLKVSKSLRGHFQLSATVVILRLGQCRREDFVFSPN